MFKQAGGRCKCPAQSLLPTVTVTMHFTSAVRAAFLLPSPRTATVGAAVENGLEDEQTASAAAAPEEYFIGTAPTWPTSH